MRSLAAVAAACAVLTVAVGGMPSAAVAAGSSPAPVCASGSCTVTYGVDATTVQSWTPPTGVSGARLVVDGAAGGPTEALSGGNQVAGGFGGQVSATVAGLSTSVPLALSVGGAGWSDGGYFGGGPVGTYLFNSVGYGGGGYSEVAVGTGSSAPALLVAGGGGAAGVAGPTGVAGGAGGGGGQVPGTGQPGPATVFDGVTLAGGGAGGAASASAGGSAGSAGQPSGTSTCSSGAGWHAGAAGTDGGPLVGGTSDGNGGGGGGGGWYGGGGGGSGAQASCETSFALAGNGGGGGGSSYAATGTTGGLSLSAVQYDDAINTSDGWVTVSYTDPLLAPSLSYTVRAGTTLTITNAIGLLTPAAQTPTTRLTAKTAPAHGTITLNNDGSFSYTPASGYAGNDSFTYTASDSAGDTATQTVMITVTPTPPTVQITAPAVGASYRQNTKATSSFTCSEGAGGPGIATCADQAGHQSGVALDTSRVGSHVLTVTATSKDGQTTVSTVTYTVTTPLRLSGISLNASTVRWCKSCNYPHTLLWFSLTAPAQVRVLLQARAHGRWRTVATTVLHGHAGHNADKIATHWHRQLVPHRKLRLVVQLKQANRWPIEKTLAITVRSP